MNSRVENVVKIAQTLVHADPTQKITPDLIGQKVRLAASIISPMAFAQEDEDAAVAELVRRSSQWIGRDAALANSEGHEQWLVASRKKDWRYWARYQSYLEQKLSSTVVGALDKSTDQILGYLEDPFRSGGWDRRGLVVGHVQSGKTGSYTGLVCKAADAGYKVIIVLAGLHNNLRSQTQIRLEEGFLGYETSESRDPGQLTGVGILDSDPAILPHCATTRADKGDFNSNVARHIASITPEQRPWLFVVKKQKTVLTHLLKWIRGHVADSTDGVSGRRFVSNLPLLVIDDEADNASVDTGEQSFSGDGTPDDEHQPKTINSLIRQILYAFEKRAYVGYTATPFANIFIHRSNATSLEGPDLFPKAFIVNLAAPSNYIGPARIFGLTTPDGRIGGLPLTRELPNSGELEEWMPLKHQKTHVPTFNGQHGVPPTLRRAIYSFILACAVRECRGQGEEHSSMLVHVTRNTAVQEIVTEQVFEVVDRAAQRLRRGVDVAELISELRSLWETDFLTTSEAVRERDGFAGEPDPRIPAWSEVLSVLADVTSDIVVKAVNGTAKDALDYVDREGKGLKVIAIGGDKLARGLTLEGLVVSYFVRTTKMYDTLMQMGRWFGYRPGYLDLCRLYTTSDLIQWFGHIADAAEELRSEFDLMAERGATPEHYGLRVQSHPVLMVTSPMKMRSAEDLLLSFSGEILETVTFFTNQVVLDKNLDAAEQLIEAMGASVSHPQHLREGKLQPFTGHLWKDVPANKIVDFLQAYATHPAARKVNSKVLAEFILSMSRECGELVTWTVVIPDGGRGATYSFKGGLTLEGMMFRTANSDAPDRYSIGRLVSPNDEAVDLDEASWNAALDLTKKVWNPDAARIKAGKPPQLPETPSGTAIRRIKGHGTDIVPPTPERGLLILYIIDPQTAGASYFREGTDNYRSKPVVGFAVSLPSTDSGVKVVYKVDHLLWEEYASAE